MTTAFEHATDEQTATQSEPKTASVQFIGYAADRPLTTDDTVKDAAFLWTTGSGGAGIVFFTGSYWSILNWRAPTPKERDAIKSRLRTLRPCTLPHVGEDCHVAAYQAWRGKVKPVLASPQQVEFLAELGPRPPDGLPALVADMAIPLLRSARQLRRGKAQMPDCFAPILERVEAAFTKLAKSETPMTLDEYWEGLIELDREVFRRAD